jgi:hypothetical protein
MLFYVGQTVQCLDYLLVWRSASILNTREASPNINVEYFMKFDGYKAKYNNWYPEGLILYFDSIMQGIIFFKYL